MGTTDRSDVQPTDPRSRRWYKRPAARIVLGAVVVLAGLSVLGAVVGPPPKKETGAPASTTAASASTVATAATTAPPPIPASTSAAAPNTTDRPNVTSITGDQHPAAVYLTAFDNCKQIIHDLLKAPSGAVWRNPRGDQVVYLGRQGGPISVRASVDAQNNFGAKLRSEYECTFTGSGPSPWHLEYLEFDGKDITP
jgi:hypothetical protein